MMAIGRAGHPGTAESQFEKVVYVPYDGDHDPGSHAWADARFATDIMAEHGLFFALLMPEEWAVQERRQALEFHQQFNDLFQSIAGSNAPEGSDVPGFCRRTAEQIKPFIEWKARLGQATEAGSFRSLVWPLFFDHTRHEAERWVRRLEQCASGDAAFDRDEVVDFWTNIMDEHAGFVAHLLDPNEYDLIEKAMKTRKVFIDLHEKGMSATFKALRDEPATVAGSLVQNPDLDAVMSAARTMLDFKTQATRDIEAARIKSIIDPRLADHVRREALKFVEELKRAE
jgi:hypothetical protein